MSLPVTILAVEAGGDRSEKAAATVYQKHMSMRSRKTLYID